LAFASAFGAPFLVWRTWVAHQQAKAAAEQARVALENHVTGIFSKSVELMGLVRETKVSGPEGLSVTRSAPNVEARLGALYSLERLLSESEKDQRAILETLCAYVRENSPLEIPKDEDEAQAFFRGELPPAPSRRADVQAALTIIGRRSEGIRARAEREGWRLDFRTTNLVSYDFSGLNYGSADLSNSFLDHANMTAANFENSIFMNSFMRAANMTRTSFRSSLFDDCGLANAKIEETDFSLCKFVMTDLRRAKVASFDIKGANLEEAFWSFGLQHALESMKKEGQNAFNTDEIMKTYQLFQKATFDKETNVSQTVRDIIEYMTQK